MMYGRSNMSGDEIKTLPENIGNIRVGGNFHLDTNTISRYPDSFANITAGYLQSWFETAENVPESFPNVTKVRAIWADSKWRK